jgi:hypothetical protein
MYRVRTTTKSGGKLVVAEKTARAALDRMREIDLAGDDVEVALADGSVLSREELEELAASEKS